MNEPKETTRQKILSAAKDVFSTIGYDGARVDEIAARAGVNKAALYYHIGDKQKLYEAVLKETFNNIFSGIISEVRDKTTPIEKLFAYVHAVIKNMCGNPYMMHIMMRELASGSQNMPESINNDFASIMATISAILKEGEDSGDFIRTSPVVVHMMIVGANSYLFMISHMKDRIKNVPFETFSLEDTFSGKGVEELKKLVVRSVLKHPEKYFPVE